MNILFLSTVFPDDAEPSRGTYNLELCRALAEDHDVRVVSPRGWTEALPRTLMGRKYHSEKVLRDTNIKAVYPTYWYPPRFCREQYGDFLWRSSRRAVRELCGDATPDAVLSYWAHPDGEAGLHAARAHGVPSAVIVGGSDVLLLPRCPNRGERVRRVLTESDAVITVSDGLREKVIELGVDAGQVHTVTQGINTKQFHNTDRAAARARLAQQHAPVGQKQAILLWVGRMVEVKRLDVLINAVSALRERGRDFVLCLVGDGPLRSATESLVKERGLVHHVLFAGAVPPVSLGDWYRTADVTVLSSESEGLPNVLRESLACGTPFVSTNVGSIAEIADERYAVLVPPNDAHALASGIDEVLKGTHAVHAREYVPRTWEEMAEDVANLFQQSNARPDSANAREGVTCDVG
ncbi:MAG: glycosyltransferase [Planctomycetaceae bacterium]